MERKCDRSVGWWERKWSQSHKGLSICGRHEACQPSNGHVVMWEGAGMPLRFLTITDKKEKRPPHICWDTRGFVWHHSQVLRGETAQLHPPGESCCQREARGRPGTRAHWRRPILQGILVLLQLSLSNSTLLTFGAGQSPGRGVHPAHCGIPGSIPSLYSLDASSNSPLPGL